MATPDNAHLKAQLRRSLLAMRRALSSTEWEHKSQAICRHLRDSVQLQQASTVLTYFSIRQEPDLAMLLSSKHRWGLPRCDDRDLSWHHWAPGDDLAPGAFGIAEPLSTAPMLAPETVDLMLVPAVACDRNGYRLGYGGGFYDRLLSQPSWAACYTIGIIFEFALLDELPLDPWDRPLNAVCTERGMVTFR